MINMLMIMINITVNKIIYAKPKIKWILNNMNNLNHFKKIKIILVIKV
jgi:hypothetical protein